MDLELTPGYLRVASSPARMLMNSRIVTNVTSISVMVNKTVSSIGQDMCMLRDCFASCGDGSLLLTVVV
jgi:hypothetical protein